MRLAILYYDNENKIIEDYDTGWNISIAEGVDYLKYMKFVFAYIPPNITMYNKSKIKFCENKISSLYDEDWRRLFMAILHVLEGCLTTLQCVRVRFVVEDIF